MAGTSTPYMNVNEDGIAALALSIIKGWSIDQAVRYVETGVKPRKRPPAGLITLDDAEDIRKLRAQGYKYKELAKKYGISMSYVDAIVCHRRMIGG